MKNGFLIGLDLGTTTVKATVYSSNGVPVAEAKKERVLLTPKPGYCEQDAMTWYYDSAEVVKKATENINKEDVLALSISSQGITTVCCDENFVPLTNAINWMDTRHVDSWAELCDKVGIDYFRNTTGFPLNREIAKGIGKVIWVRENLPEVFKKTKHILMPSSFMTAMLTGNALVDHTMAAGSLVYSNATNSWDGKILKNAEIDKSLLPEIVPAGTNAGNLTEKAARDFNLTANCKVAVGGQDQKVAAFGIGADETVASCSIGTSAAIEFVSASVPSELPRYFKLCPYILPNMYAHECCINAAGASIRWLNEVICDKMDYEKMNMLASTSPKGANGVMFKPFIGGHPDGNGFGSFIDIGVHTVKADLIRAVFEGIAFEARYLFELANTKKIKCIRVFSGGSKSKILCQILSDVLNIEVQQFEHSEMGSLGAAKLAAIAVGLNEKVFSENMKFTVYRPQDRDIYDSLFSKYKDIR